MRNLLQYGVIYKKKKQIRLNFRDTWKIYEKTYLKGRATGCPFLQIVNYTTGQSSSNNKNKRCEGYMAICMGKKTL